MSGNLEALQRLLAAGARRAILDKVPARYSGHQRDIAHSLSWQGDSAAVESACAVWTNLLAASMPNVAGKSGCRDVLRVGWLCLQDDFSPADLAEACRAREVREYLSSLDAKVQESKIKQYQQWL